jgi:hypothetical protein
LKDKIDKWSLIKTLAVKTRQIQQQTITNIQLPIHQTTQPSQAMVIPSAATTLLQIQTL